MTLKNNELLTPFLKWAGGKRQMTPSLVEYFPANVKTYEYVEPFVGGGAALFHLQPKKAVVNDLNAELINVYRVVKDNLSTLISDLKKHENNAEYFYKIRNIDRMPGGVILESCVWVEKVAGLLENGE
jgi:DNA adenine methylase